MDRWYAWVDNQMYGPYQPDQLSEFTKPETMLCREGTEEWKAAKDYPELTILFSNVNVEAKPSTGWLVRPIGIEFVLGPFTKEIVMEMIDKGEITMDSEIKHTDWDEWEIVGKTKLVARPALADLIIRPPSPEGFLSVIRESGDQELMKEYKENYKLYARRERKMIKEELLRRGLIKKTFGLF